MRRDPSSSHFVNPELVLCELSDGVATLTLNRPERLNAWTVPLQERLYGRSVTHPGASTPPAP
jgi:hypothetical protein